MTTHVSAPLPASGPATSRVRLGRIFALESRYELVKLLRTPAYAIPALAFPLMFYGLFGVAFGGPAQATYLLATYGVFGVLGASLFGFGVGVAVERGQGWMLLKRASPMPPFAYFFAKAFSCLVFSALIVLGLCALGALAGGVRLETAQWLALTGVLLGGSLPFCVFGLTLGYLAGPSSAPAVVNLIYLPVAFASGLWIPIHMLPGWVQSLATVLPPYYFAQLALSTVAMPAQEPVAVCVGVLAAFAVVSLGTAYLAYRRDEGKTYG